MFHYSIQGAAASSFFLKLLSLKRKGEENWENIKKERKNSFTRILMGNLKRNRGNREKCKKKKVEGTSENISSTLKGNESFERINIYLLVVLYMFRF